jgi:uncharacterized iron-regulated protein
MALGILLSFVVPFLQPPPQALAQQPSAIVWTYVPQRVFDTRQNAFGDFETMLADLSRADVVFVGEQHDDPNTHRLELAIVEGLVRRRTPVVIAMEMFERDVQGALDQYVQGSSTEQQFLSASRPWPRYATDYRPIIEFAKTHGIPVIGSDVPRHVAQEVAKSGMSAVEALGKDRALAARDVQCDKSGEYYERFIEAMGGHPPSGDPKSADAAAKNERFYLAQCLKDETMGESIAEAFQKNAARRATIVHINGAFHSDYAEGTAASARRRMPGRRIAVVSIVPVEDIDAAKPDKDDLKLGDYILYTVKQPGNP